MEEQKKRPGRPRSSKSRTPFQALYIDLIDRCVETYGMTTEAFCEEKLQKSYANVWKGATKRSSTMWETCEEILKYAKATPTEAADLKRLWMIDRITNYKRGAVIDLLLEKLREKCADEEEFNEAVDSAIAKWVAEGMR